MTQPTKFRPTIPVAVWRGPQEHVADGEAESRPTMGAQGFATRYVTTLTLLDGHERDELLEDQQYELILGTGHALSGYFYPAAEDSMEQNVLLFIPAEG